MLKNVYRQFREHSKSASPSRLLAMTTRNAAQGGSSSSGDSDVESGGVRILRGTDPCVAIVGLSTVCGEAARTRMKESK